jgi:hypothetical protein
MAEMVPSSPVLHDDMFTLMGDLIYVGLSVFADLALPNNPFFPLSSTCLSVTIFLLKILGTNMPQSPPLGKCTLSMQGKIHA